MKDYVVWNNSKISELGLCPDSTYDQLKQAEIEQNTSCSSVIKCDNIESVIEAIYNETDVKLSYYLIKR